MTAQSSPPHSRRSACVPPSDDVVSAAAYWLTELMSDDVTPATRQRWQQWLQADPSHQQAWQRFEQFEKNLAALEPKAAHRSLSTLRSPGKRKALKQLAGLAVAGVGVAALHDTDVWRRIGADYSTDTGEQRRLVLADGSFLRLNTGTAVDITDNDRYCDIRLLYGEIALESAPDARRQLRVLTRDGEIHSLGAQFIARQRPRDTLVSVLRHAVELERPDWPRPVSVQAGHRASLMPAFPHRLDLLDDTQTAWLRGEFMATDMRLADFLEEVQRYYKGWLRCAPEVADLRLTTLIPELDPERALTVLANTLPVRLQYRTRYWVTVVPA